MAAGVPGNIRQMRALVVGCGSIGRRHIENLLKIKEIKEILVCTKSGNRLDGLRREKIKIIDSINNADADIAIISNETYKHMPTAIKLAAKGINILIEKPISHDLKKLDLLGTTAKRKKIKLTVGYNLRFLGALKYIKKQLDGKALGDLYFARIEAGQYLPLWRAGRDYAQTYSASRIKGGGVALDLSHELDYMRYLFGDPVSAKTFKSKVSQLKIDSEDLFEGIYKFRGGFVCGVHLDYLQRDKTRNLRIIGSKGTLTCDLVNKKIVLIKNGSESIVTDKQLFDINGTYMDELISFIESVKKGQDPAVTLEDGVEALRLTR